MSPVTSTRSRIQPVASASQSGWVQRSWAIAQNLLLLGNLELDAEREVIAGPNPVDGLVGEREPADIAPKCCQP